jgi:hypothetical protein
MLKCRICGELVQVAETTSGKTMPLQVQSVTGYKLSMDATGKLFADATEIYRPHVCAQPKLVG